MRWFTVVALAVSLLSSAPWSTAAATGAEPDGAPAAAEPLESPPAVEPADEPVSDASSPGEFPSIETPSIGVPPIGTPSIGTPADAAQAVVDESRALVDLGVLQISTREFLEAERTLEQSVALIEDRSDRYDPDLVEPLTLLGDARRAQGEFEQALDTYERAVHVTRVNDGLHAPAQVDIVYREAAALIEMGEPGKANDRQEYAYEVLLRSHGAGNPELIPGLYKLADWYRRTNNVFAARGLYEFAVRLLVRAYGQTDPRLIPALHGVAETYRLERFPPNDAGRLGESISITTSDGGYPAATQSSHTVNRFSDGEEALQRIVQIVQANPDAGPEDEALAMLELADWYLLFDKWSRAQPLYEHSQTLLRDEAHLAEDRIAEYFGQPVPLYLPLPEAPAPPPAALRGDASEGYVEVGYTVDDRGNVDDLTTLDSKPDGLLDFKVRRAMRVARFRPRFEGPTPVATTNLKFRHSYSYFPRSDEAATEDGATVAEEERSTSS